jgi:hypothetical protein
LIGGLAGVTAAVVIGSVSRDRRPDAPSQVLYAPTATIKDLMDAIVDPSADDVWNAVSTTVDSGGITEKVPRTEQDWAEVRHGAIRLVEGANLLMMPGRHMARPGERSETPGVELEPREMDVLVSTDPAAWNARAKALRDVSMEVLQAIDAKDGDKLSDVGGRLDTACENCHRQYWYPNEKIPDFPAALH